MADVISMAKQAQNPASEANILLGLCKKGLSIHRSFAHGSDGRMSTRAVRREQVSNVTPAVAKSLDDVVEV